MNKGNSIARAAAWETKRTRVNQRGKTATVYEAELRRNVRTLPVRMDMQGNPVPGRVTMIDGVRVGRDGLPRSKVYGPCKADTPKHLRRPA